MDSDVFLKAKDRKKREEKDSLSLSLCLEMVRRGGGVHTPRDPDLLFALALPFAHQIRGGNFRTRKGGRRREGEGRRRKREKKTKVRSAADERKWRLEDDRKSRRPPKTNFHFCNPLFAFSSMD